MIKSNSLRVHLLVLLYDSFKSGLSHAESARIHGVGVSTSRYVASGAAGEFYRPVSTSCACRIPEAAERQLLRYQDSNLGRQNQNL